MANEIESNHNQGLLNRLLDLQKSLALNNFDVADLQKSIAEIIKNLTIPDTLPVADQLFRDLFYKNADAVGLIEDYRFIDCNPATLHLFKLKSKASILHVHPIELSPEQQPDGSRSADKMKQMMDLAYKNGTHRFEWMHQRSNGELFYAEVLLTRIHFDKNTYLHGVWRDISDFIKKRHEYRLNEDSYQFLFDEAAEGILVGNYTGEIINANARMENITGYTPEELIGTNISRLFPDYVLTKTPLRYDLLKKGQTVLFERELQKKNGDIITIEMNTKVVEKHVLQTYIRDITSRKTQEKKTLEQNKALEEARFELQEKNNQLHELNKILEVQKSDISRVSKMLKTVIDHIPVGVFWKDKNLNYLGANSVFLQKLGMSSAEEIIGKNDFDLTVQQKAKKYRADDKMVIDSGKPILKIEETLPDANNVMHTTLTNKIPLLNEFNKIIGVLGTYEDITEIKEIQKKLLAAKEKAEESDRLKSAFLANMSHEIRTPMNGILGFAQVLQNQDLPHETREKFLNIIQQSGLQLLGIINNLVDISKIESGQMTVTRAKVNLNELIKEQVQFFELEAKDKKVKLTYQLGADDQKALFYCDAQKLRQVFVNLINNAIKYTVEGGQIVVSYKILDDHCKFFVKDTGLGIPDTFKPLIFKRFHQESNKVTNIYGGSGLGLAICKAFVEMCHGKIWFESEQNKGTTFYFTIPKEH